RQALEIINSAPRISDFVFSYSGEAMRDFDGRKPVLEKQSGVGGWTLHDLRRTAVSGMASLGVQLPVIERIVNHVSGSFAGIVGVYQRHEFAGEKREALQRWADHVAGLVS